MSRAPPPPPRNRAPPPESQEPAGIDPVSGRPVAANAVFARADNLVFESAQTQAAYYNLLKTGHIVVFEDGKPKITKAKMEKVWELQTEDGPLAKLTSRSTLPPNAKSATLGEGFYEFQAIAPELKDSYLANTRRREITVEFEVTGSRGLNIVPKLLIPLSAESPETKMEFRVVREQAPALVRLNFTSPSLLHSLVVKSSILKRMSGNMSEEEAARLRKLSASVMRSDEFLVELEKDALNLGMTLTWDQLRNAAAVKSIHPDGVAARSKMIREGDAVRAVQGIRMEGLNAKTVQQHLSNVPVRVILVMQHAPADWQGFAPKPPARAPGERGAPPPPPRRQHILGQSPAPPRPPRTSSTSAPAPPRPARSNSMRSAPAPPPPVARPTDAKPVPIAAAAAPIAPFRANAPPPPRPAPVSDHQQPASLARAPLPVPPPNAASTAPIAPFVPLVHEPPQRRSRPAAPPPPPRPESLQSIPKPAPPTPVAAAAAVPAVAAESPLPTPPPRPQPPVRKAAPHPPVVRSAAAPPPVAAPPPAPVPEPFPVSQIQQVSAPIVAEAPPPLSPPTRSESVSSAAEFGPEYSKYVKMKRAGLPDGAIVNAMNRDGVPIPDGFFPPEFNAPKPVAIKITAAAASKPEATSAPQGGGGGSLMDALKGFDASKLKKHEQSGEEAAEAPRSPSNPLLAELEKKAKGGLRKRTQTEIEQEEREKAELASKGRNMFNEALLDKFKNVNPQDEDEDEEAEGWSDFDM